MKGRRVVIPVELFIDSICLRANEFLTRCQTDRSFTEGDAIACLMAITRDTISTRSHSDQRQNNVDEVLLAFDPIFCSTKACDDFWIDVLDTVDIQLSVFIDNFIPEKTWDMWIVRGVSNESLYIESYGDYRIWYYHQHLESTEHERKANNRPS